MTFSDEKVVFRNVKVTFSREKMTFSGEKVTFRNVKVTFSCIKMSFSYSRNFFLRKRTSSRQISSLLITNYLLIMPSGMLALRALFGRTFLYAQKYTKCWKKSARCAAFGLNSVNLYKMY